MSDRKSRFFLLIVEFIYLSTEIFELIYNIWMSKAIKISFIIFFCFNIIYYIFFFLYILKIYKKEGIIKVLIHIICIPFLLYILNYVIYLIILSLNISKFLKYWKYCPYLITDLDYNLHFERRCELYNINNNSRYSYQYICSYDSSKDFKKHNLKNKIKIDNIICIPVKEVKKNEYNEVKNLFKNEYKNLNNYYCSRTNMPKNYSFVNHKNCKKTKYILNIAFYIIFIFEYIFFYFMCILIARIIIIQGCRPPPRRRLSPSIRRSYPNNNERNIINDRMLNNNEANREYIENRFRAMINELNSLRDFRNLNNNNQLNNDTKASENPYMDNSFIQDKTRNIILENKQEYSIETNIKNIISNKDKKILNAIKLNEINIQILNSDKNELKNNS